MQIKFINTSKTKSQENIFAKFNLKPPAFASLPSHKFPKIEKFVKENRKWKFVLVIGIGGSCLPPKTLVNALGKKNSPQFFYLDNLDAKEANEIFAKLKWKETLVIVVSKSGGTLETLANFFVVKKFLGKSWKKQVVALTDGSKGFLRKLVEKEGLISFEIPRDVGGRYSIFTSVGLLPYALSGGSITKLLEGASRVKVEQAFEYAKIQATEFQRGKNINVFCVYAKKLEAFAKWFEQLLAESIGKNSKVGITPEVAVGATDQHSKLQLWMDGPNDKFFTFFGVKKVEIDFPIPGLPKEFEILKGASLNKILFSEFQATTQALKEKRRSIAKFTLEKINEESLGYLLQFFMLEIALLGKLLKVNPYNQPGVERGKVLAKKMLSRK